MSWFDISKHITLMEGIETNFLLNTQEQRAKGRQRKTVVHSAPTLDHAGIHLSDKPRSDAVSSLDGLEPWLGAMAKDETAS